MKNIISILFLTILLSAATIVEKVNITIQHEEVQNIADTSLAKQDLATGKSYGK